MIKTTILSVSVHRDTENPVFGIGATIVSIEDEGGGPFFELRQCNDNVEVGMIRLDIDEVESISAAARMLTNQYVTP